MGNVENGKTLFMRLCAMCHTDTPGGKNRVGPNLFGIYGKKCGTVPGYDYTETMKTKGLIWDDDNLDKYLQFPRKFMPGTKMVFNGMKKPNDRKDVIAYLASLK